MTLPALRPFVSLALVSLSLAACSSGASPVPGDTGECQAPCGTDGLVQQIPRGGMRWSHILPRGPGPMNVLRRIVAILFPLALSVSACKIDVEPQRDAPGPTATAAHPAPTAEARSTTGGPRFAPGQLEHHFAKHGAEMGFATKEEYLRAAQALVRGGPGVETYQRGGDTLFFKESTDEFAVLSDRGVIRTYFKPNDGRRYWERQKER